MCPHPHPYSLPPTRIWENNSPCCIHHQANHSNTQQISFQGFPKHILKKLYKYHMTVFSSSSSSSFYENISGRAEVLFSCRLSAAPCLSAALPLPSWCLCLVFFQKFILCTDVHAREWATQVQVSTSIGHWLNYQPSLSKKTNHK